MNPTVTFVVPGRPVPKARARVVNGRAFTPKRTKDYEAVVRWCALAAVQGHRVRLGPWDTGCSYAVRIAVTPPDRRRADVDNIAKAVLDACNGTVWVDDSQVVQLEVFRCAPDAAHPSVVVTVRALVADPGWTT